VQFSFESIILHWRGPSPYFFAPVPQADSDAIRRLAKLVSYGWGVIPVEATVAGVTFTTSLFPKDGAYLLPLKDAVRRKAALTAGDSIVVEMALRPPRAAP
jgi:hypothetical protein